MILPTFVIPEKANQVWAESGIDSLEKCVNREHFLNFPHQIQYAYNSRGYRDSEWPSSLDQLQSAIWCVGDSFTAGIGQPAQHTWPHLLSHQLNQRTINVSMDGASNAWIARKAQEIIDVVNPVAVVMLWSYTHRREHHNTLLTDEQRRLPNSRDSYEQDYLHWVQLVSSIQPANGTIVHATIPRFDTLPSPRDNTSLQQLLQQHWDAIKGSNWPVCPATVQELQQLPAEIKHELIDLHHCYSDLEQMLQNSVSTGSANTLPDNIIHVQQLDWARDYHHFEILTAQWLVDQVCAQLQS